MDRGNTGRESGEFEREVANLVGDLKCAMARRRSAEAGRQAKSAWNRIAAILCTHVGPGGPMFGEVIVERLPHPSPSEDSR